LPELIQEVIATISVVEREVQDSQGRWYSMRIRPYKTEAMKMDGAVMLLVDINNLKQAEAALSESNQKWQKLVDGIPDFILDPAGQILFINRTLVSIAQGAKVGTSIYQGIDINDRAVLKASLENVGRTGQASTFQTKPTGGVQQRILETVISPIKNNGNLIAMTMVTKQLQPFGNSGPESQS